MISRNNGLTELLTSTTDGFEIDDDSKLLDKIRINLKKYEEQYEKQLRVKQDKNKAIEQEINETKKRIESLEKSEEIKKLLNEINKMNSSKFETAKNISSLTNDINTLNIQYQNIKEERIRLNEEANNFLEDSINNNPDSTALKLNFYKNLGLIIQDNKNNQENRDNIDLIIVNQSENKKSTTTLTIGQDKKGLSDYFITNYIWENI
ncbi:uncharacterized protein ASCRUDRAFT_94217 [Ascoidea rubescens DSM 1968]|uniref:Kinetochore protein Spc24 n=1 Tax=Ascoidea rubescens DSM 1968 TaxID=1344418 RepID=A0A1D2VNY4_9ASCO|nr:hypothetical protein ASCRUDRAFT_94217 [Ascoidea rubescens DSM 1968]ODV63304.1 hypothetical protein ASCRUDRAFT_94217 [Ascoidea rubescens DSM 1968]